MDYIEDKFRNVLDRDETILWTGTPNFKTWMISGIPFLVLGISDLVFMMIVFISFGTTMLPVLIFGILFLVIFTLPFWGSILYMVWLFYSHKNAVYAFTNKRVMIRSGVFGIDYQIIDYDKIRDMQVNVNPIEKNITSVRFYLTPEK
ncbi:MAG: PH domain-containing protein [Planctomycetaceae bacterium]|jgi:membrane protein YdbS with pleckstrin-like domain|nr:PH domain-containing protein [Planctomycetaceae bacterium]